VKIAVLGLGYVGAVTAICLARDGHEVIGVDVDHTKLDLLRAGRAPIVEDGLQEPAAAAAKSGRLALTDAVDERLASCDIVFVCVGTPSAANGSQSLVAVERVLEQLGSALRDCRQAPTIVLRSTVPPGTTDTLVTPLLERTSRLRDGSTLSVCFQPEFLREGTSVADFYNPPFTVVGSRFERSTTVVRELFRALPREFIVTDTRTAEMLKLTCNAFHALKVSFANEIGRLGRSLSLDSRRVMELLCKDDALNISPAYLRPGFAYGGSCLPKDLRALLYLAKRNDIEMPMLSGSAVSNSAHIEHVATLVKQHGSRRVGLLGLSFKPGTDDLRESPLVALAEHLIGKGFDLRVYDPAVSVARLIGANRRYIEQTIPHIGSLMSDSLSDVCAHGHVLVVGFNPAGLPEAMTDFDRPGSMIVDLAGIDPSAVKHARYQGVCW